jgi:hypothetical protein
VTTLASLIDGAGAKFRADLENSDRVSDTQWAALANAAVLRAWTKAASARPDFQVSSQDSTVVSGQSASFAAPSNMFGIIDIVANPDTQNEYSLGPFAWANRKAPGNWGPPTTIFQSSGARRARLMGSTIYLEPATSAGATYRVWFCPKPTALVQADFTVRATSPGADIMVNQYITAGLGVGKTLTSAVPGAQLSVDGVALGLGDRFLLKNATNSNDNGIYSVTQFGNASNGLPWIATRATDYDSNSEIKVGQLIAVSEGTLASTFWSLSSFSGFGIDAGPMTFSVAIPVPTNILDPILDPFIELLQVQMAITALRRDQRPPSEWVQERDRLEGELTQYFSLIRGVHGPQKIVDTDARGPTNWRGGW